MIHASKGSLKIKIGSTKLKENIVCQNLWDTAKGKFITLNAYIRK